MTIHWCGTGLSAIPGLRRLIESGREVTVWNRSPDKARKAVGDLTDRIETFTPEALAARVAPGDIVVSMLPGDMHVPLAQMCLEKDAHFVSSSYISPEMRALNDAALDKGLRFVNEVGLDPGIDHLMAHALVEDYRRSPACDPENALSFLSYCGGVPKIPNAFRYKFSWSPLGVLKALRSPSRSIRHWSVLDVARPWDAIGSYTAPLPQPEVFEVYPNRDSLPFIQQYRFDPSWKVKDFVRGTLRLNGWAEAWAPVFAEVEELTGPEGEARLREMSDQFWRDHAYEPGEPDRVILVVELKAERDGTPVWHQSFVLDASGDARGSAMARLVSTPVALAIEAVSAKQIPAGVTAAPHDPALVAKWLAEVDKLSEVYLRIDHLK
ncbi:saccharopine dehydrogenase family protein [Frigidibacter sp. ROC022]|uniref:saccharopine dehydrogenase family protein n=1 Tax=Frigidibacter sp. ROC022 TaxID=2971796 RepID=UPI00215B33A3|nr:saccharopine dehydrogenase family protein [Frigidibacter sp. ROC022]MCR8724878.1 saccharopine dehydrogenase NADP-binding domain-containing protein [Frigidibacter sp. ROC022]